MKGGGKKMRVMISGALLMVFVLLACACDGNGGEVTEEMAREAAKILKAWQDQKR